MVSSGVVLVIDEADKAAESSPRKTMTMEAELVRKSRKVSAGLFRLT